MTHTWLCPACGSADLTWLSGEVGVHISLNGHTAAFCNNCDADLEMED